MRVNRIKWSKMKLEWEGRLGAAHTFKGVRDFEEWAMAQSPPQPIDPPTISDLIDESLQEWESAGWMNSEDMYRMHQPLGEKEKLFAQALELRKQIDDAIKVEDYEKADILTKTLDVIKIKYDKL